MKVLYDYQIFSSQKVGGISRYFYELINSSHEAFSPCLAIKYHKNLYIEQVVKSIPYPSKTQYLGKRSFPGRGILGRIMEQCWPSENPVHVNQEYVRQQLSLLKPDIFHPTYYGDYYLDDLRGTPVILTIYDMIHEIFPEYFRNDNTSILKKKLVSHAKHIIAISETTKNDIINIYGVSDEKISVVPLAHSLFNVDDVSVKFKAKLPQRYLLFVGRRGGYKNFQFFVTAISDLLKKEDDLCVICTGPTFRKSEIDFFEWLGITHKIFHNFVTDTELAFLYRNAAAFIFPSLYEGFGIPVLEAFSCDCPVLLSQSGSLPEIGGEAAIYFNPKSADEIRTATQRVVNDVQLRQTLVTKGRERLKFYSWADTVQKTTDVYKNVYIK